MSEAPDTEAGPAAPTEAAAETDMVLYEVIERTSPASPSTGRTDATPS